MSDAAYGRLERRRYAVRRLTSAVIYGLAGAAAGVGIILYLRLHE